MSSDSLQDRWNSDEPMVFSGAPIPEDLPPLADGEIAFATSGSSGEPKFIVHSRASLEESARMVNRHLGANHRELWLVALPSFHVGGFGVHLRAWQLGSEAIELGNRWAPEAFVQAIDEHQIAWSSLVPAQVGDLVTLGKPAPDHLRGIIVGGGALNTTTAQAARDLGWPVAQSYGMTETGSQVATGLPTEPFSPTLTLLLGWEARLGEGGVLALRGKALADRLLRRGHEGSWEAHPLCDTDGWFTTTDCVDLHPDRHLTWQGRADSMIKVLGELVSLDALQADLETLSPNAAIIDRPTGRDRELVLVVESSVADPDQLLHAFNSERPGFQKASRIQAVHFPIPRSELGKLRRAALAAKLS